MEFELGRTSQIPGLLDEARALAALAVRAALQTVVLVGGNPHSELNKVILHSMKPANTELYKRGLARK